MSLQLRITLIITIAVYFIVILLLLKRKALQLKYTLLWLFAGLVMGVMVCFPDLLTRYVRFFGIISNMNGLFVLCIAFIIAILMALTSIVSRQMTKIRTLVQEMALLEKKIRELKKEEEQ